MTPEGTTNAENWYIMDTAQVHACTRSNVDCFSFGNAVKLRNAVKQINYSNQSAGTLLNEARFGY